MDATQISSQEITQPGRYIGLSVCLCLYLFSKTLIFSSILVVPNSLIVAPDAPNPVVREGGSIRLLCNVSRNFMEGIYLSLTWSVKKGSSLLEDLLTFGPDLGVTVGDDYMLRYTDGGMRLEMGNGVSHSLVLSGAMPADQGMYVCTARLWTREQGAWNRIQEKTMEMGEVTVTSTG